MGCPASGPPPHRRRPRRAGPRGRRDGALTSGSVSRVSWLTDRRRASPNAVREGNVVLVDGLRLAALRDAGPAAPAVRHAQLFRAAL